jgi:rare lipoprotein A
LKKNWFFLDSGDPVRIKANWAENDRFRAIITPRRTQISIPQTHLAAQLKGICNRFWMFDLGSPRQDNNRWSVRMRSTYFRRAQPLSPASVRKFGIGLLMMGLSLAASAKDATATDNDPAAPAVAVRPKAMKLGSKTKHWYQVGVASWYGSHFQGHKTAAGERFDMNLMTCAHPNHPMGTWLRVTNLKNRKTAFVRVNDRGPVPTDRIVDLSFAAAKSLGLAGLGKVKLEAVLSGDPDLARALVAQLQLPVLFDPLTH